MRTFSCQGKETPCYTCPKPFLDEGNIETWEVFQLLSTQIRTGGLGGFIGFDYAALSAIFEAKQVPIYEREFVLDKIRLLTEVASKYLNKKEGQT